MLSKVSNVSLLVTPLNPSRSCYGGVDNGQGVHTLRVLKGVSDHDVGPQTHAQPDIADNSEVIDHLVQLERNETRNYALETGHLTTSPHIQYVHLCTEKYTSS